MLGGYWSNDHIRNYTVIFGSLFNDMYVKRDSASKTELQKIKVPIGYGPTEKTLARVRQQPDLEEPLSIQLPRMSFELANIVYDADRKLNNLGKIRTNSNFVYNPVPYNIIFNLYIMTNTTTDGLRIVEQILPFFTPSFNIPTKILESLNIEHDIPIVLDSVQQQDNYEGDLLEKRSIIWTLTFTLKGYLYGGVRDGKLIKHVEARIFDGFDMSKKIESVIVTGGQTEDGQATSTRPPSRPWQDVDPTGDWEFITEIDLS